MHGFATSNGRDVVCLLRLASAALLMLTLGNASVLAQGQRAPAAQRADEIMSTSGRLATEVRKQIESEATAAVARALEADAVDRQDDDACQNDPRCPAVLREGPRGGQAELTIALDATGQFVVVGFNDTRGFATNPISVSGYLYSTDGGKTFTDGGQLPVTTGTSTIGSSPTLFPQVFGDPDVKYLGGCTFVYSSILIKKFTDTGVAQTMGVHRSTDCGQTWTGPYEIAAATNPNGQVTPGGSAVDAADKEFIDVDPDTGRLIVTWSNFTATAIEMRSAISDDGGLTWPAALGRVISAVDADGQASIPRFAEGSTNVYVAWRRFPFPGTLGGLGNAIAFARSTDNGLTWGAPIELSPEFLTMDQVLGNDRVNTSPSLAVDTSGGPRNGHIYVVYANNNSQDGADVIFQKSTNAGVSFSAPIVLNSRPGNDRAQWFPWVTVDDVTGRVAVFYYDQGIASTGDLSEVSYTFSNNGGTTWSPPRPLTTRPFHAGHGNDTGQPNLGDYNQAVARGGKLWAAYALAGRPPFGFVDGQPDTRLTVPDAEVRIVTGLEHLLKHATVSLGQVEAQVSGSPDPGETVQLQLPLFNYVTNPLNQDSVRLSVGFLQTTTAGVDILNGVGLYPQIPAGQTRNSFLPYRIRLRNTFVPGTPVELSLTVISLDGIAVLHHTLFTGTPVETTLLQENFDAVAPSALPAGWQAVHGAGVSTVPWTTSNTFCGSSNGAFHQNANDNPTGSPARWERLLSPTFTVPGNAEYVLVEFDVCYDTEEDPNFNVLAYDGFFLRVADLTPGQTLRSVLVEAFEDEFTTGAIQHYPRHFPRSSNTSYFEDMSAWAGSSGGVQHVRLRLPGMKGTTAQLRFEFTQDTIATCQDIRPGSPACGVFVDNLVVKSVTTQVPAPLITP